MTAPTTTTSTVTGVKSWLPTRKWYAAAIGGVASIVATWIVSGAFDDTEKGMLATLVTGLVAAYFQLNQSTLEGVPVKERSYGTG